MIRILLILLLFSSTVRLSAQVQTIVQPSAHKNHITSNMPDKALNEKMINALTKRIPETQSVRVTWNPASYGYVASYSFDNINRMVVFNSGGNLIEVFTQSSWDDRVPEIIKLEFNNGAYNTYDVINFWEGSGLRTTYYYLEMQSRQDGTSRNVWCDENGKFYNLPF